jgi:hypothetical protein
MANLITSSQILTVAATSDEFTSKMVVGYNYRLISTTNCWFKISATGGTAAAAANNVYLAAGVPIEIKATDATDAFVQVIRATADGTANLARLG